MGSLKRTVRRRSSGLYAFPFSGLARDRRRRNPDGFPDFGRCGPGRFRPGGQALPRECSTTELRQPPPEWSGGPVLD